MLWPIVHGACFLRRQRKDAIPRYIHKDILETYIENSRISPCKRDANYGRHRIKGSSGHPKRFLECTLAECYKIFCDKLVAKGLQNKVSQRYFEMKRPFYVKLLSRDHRIVCACQKDVNTKLMLTALQSFRHKKESQGIMFKYHLSNHLSEITKEVVCYDEQKEFTEQDVQCFKGSCVLCGTSALDKYIEVRSLQLMSMNTTFLL